MTNHPIISASAAALMVLLGFSTTVRAEIEVLEAEAYHDCYTMYPAGSHGPCSGSFWRHEIEDGPSFHWEHSEEQGCLVAAWSAHCDTDGLFYAGQWHNGFQGIYGPWGIIMEPSYYTCLIDVSAPALLVASRKVDVDGPYGFIFADEHTVTLTYPDETTEVLISAESSTDEAWRSLEAGVYRVTIHIQAVYIGLDPFQYSGTVQVAWQPAVGSEGETWGSVKAMYR